MREKSFSWPVVGALLVLVALAAALRLYRLDTLPAGLHHDEASNGMLALRILAGEYPVFFSAYTGKEALYMYLVALAIAAFGQTVLAIRLPAALAGVALVPAIFLVGRRAMGERGALLAAGAAACAPWLLHIQRIGFRASLLPLLLTLWAWLLLRSLEGNRGRDWVGAGLVLGLTAYTYTAARLVPLLVLAFVGYLALWQRPLLRRCWRGLVAMLLAAMLLAAPLVLHFLRTPADWGERLEQIGACSGVSAGACVVLVAQHFGATLAMVGFVGDPIGFFNTPGAPALPVWVGWLFYPGVALALWRVRQPAMALLLLWWVVLVLPGVLSHDSPHFLRTVGAAPPTMLLWALPLTGGGGKRDAGHTSRPALLLHGAGVVLLLLMATLSTYDYFGQWAHRPERYYDYMGYATDAAQVAAAIPDTVDLYLSEEYYRHPTYRYLAPRTEQARWFDARYGVVLAQAGRHSVYLISPATPVDARAGPFLSAAAGENVVNAHGQYAYTRLDMPDGATAGPAPARPLQVAIGGAMCEGYTVGEVQADGSLPVALFWRVVAPTERELRVFLHLVDGAGRLVGQHDTIGYPSREWRAGDRFVSLHTIPMDGAALNRDNRLHMGLYDVVTGARLPAAGGDVVVLPVE